MGHALKQKPRNSWNNIFVHLLLWGVIFILPYFLWILSVCLRGVSF